MGGVYAVVGHLGTVDDDLENQVALAGAKDRVVGGSPPVILLQAVLEVERLAGEWGEVDDHVGALGHAEPDALDSDRLGQEVAVAGDLPEQVVGAQVRQIGQEELVEPRWSGVQPAEPVPARADVQHRLDLAVDRELVAQDAVQVEQVEKQEACPRIEALVGKYHGDVERGEARQMEAGVLVAGVELVEEEVEPGQPFVDVLRGEVHAVVVVPERAHRLVDVAAGGRVDAWRGLVVREDSGQDVRVVLVVEVSALEEVARVAIALRRRVTVVQVSADRRQPEAAILILRRQLVEVADQDRLSVMGHVDGSRYIGRLVFGRGADREAPEGPAWRYRGHAHVPRPLSHRVELLRRKLRERLMRDLAAFTRGRVRSRRWRWSERGRRLNLHGPIARGREQIIEGSRRRATTDVVVVVRISRARTQAPLRDEIPRARQETHLEEVASA